MKILDIPRSGSIGGTTSSHNRAGQYVRNRRTPTNTPTARRTTIRAAFGTASSVWSSLTPTEQESWFSYAADHPITDALGQAVTLTGHQMFVSIGTQLLNVGVGIANTVPGSSVVDSVSDAVTTISHTTGLSLTVTPGSGDAFFCLAVSRVTSPGRSFNKTFTQVLVSQGDQSPVTLSAAALAAVTGTLTIGAQVFVKITPVNSNGVTGVAKVMRVVIT